MPQAEFSIRRAVSTAPPHSTTALARSDRGAACGSSAPTQVTPATRPLPSTSTRVTMVRVASVQFPVAIARTSTVFWVPFLASLGQPKPTQDPHSGQAGRPSRGTVLMSSGGTVVDQPSAFAPRVRKRRLA